MHLLHGILRIVFHLLYHPFAWAYDRVAAIVSLGRWQEWVQAVIPFLQGPRLLELGHGPGHLQQFLLERGLLPFGLDESVPMGRLARRNLRKSGCMQPRLTRGLAQALPFPTGSFHTVVATFPSDYILDPHTLAEARRVLISGGQLVILPIARITGRGLPDRFFAWLLRVTGETPHPARQALIRFMTPIEQAGFKVEARRLECNSSQVFLILARKT